MKNVYVIGFNLSHDSSVALIKNGQVHSALALERSTRIKRGTVRPHAYTAAMADLSRELLDDAGLQSNQVDYWVASSTESRDANDERRLVTTLGLLVPPERVAVLPHPSHHLAHASAAFYTSGYDKASALVVDAYGSLIGEGRERESAFLFNLGRQPEVLSKTLRSTSRVAGTLRDGDVWLPDTLSGIGEVYRVVTLALGFRETGTKYDDAGKTMGLAAYGRRFSNENIFMRVEGGALQFDGAVDVLITLGFAVRINGEVKLLPRKNGEPLEQKHKDLAAQIQSEFEVACLHLARDALQRGGNDSLVLSGGCFLNSVVNSRIKNELAVKRLFVFPAATDDGNAIGAALYAYHNLIPNSSNREAATTPPISHLFLGPERIKGQDITSLAERWKLTATALNDQAVTQSAAAALCRGEIVGWFQGRSEFGPRALGGRSILCHPGLAGMKSKLNSRVKFRESFRPFAASILAEEACNWFNAADQISPFMLMVCSVIETKRNAILEVVHVDGSCRVQTVDPDTPNCFRSLLENFFQMTGLPLLLNTSFNVRGMPIVERPEEAMSALYSSRIDRLFIGNYEIDAPNFSALVPVKTEHGYTNTYTGGSLTNAYEFLSAVDGEDSIGELANKLGEDVEGLVDVALALKKDRLLKWRDCPELEDRTLLAQYGTDV
jgi:carbamoyltransferase